MRLLRGKTVQKVHLHCAKMIHERDYLVDPEEHRWFRHSTGGMFETSLAASHLVPCRELKTLHDQSLSVITLAVSWASLWGVTSQEQEKSIAKSSNIHYNPSSLAKSMILLFLHLLTLALYTILLEVSLIHYLLSFNIYFLKKSSQFTLCPQNNLMRRWGHWQLHPKVFVCHVGPTAAEGRPWCG